MKIIIADGLKQYTSSADMATGGWHFGVAPTLTYGNDVEITSENKYFRNAIMHTLVASDHVAMSFVFRTSSLVNGDASYFSLSPAGFHGRMTAMSATSYPVCGLYLKITNTAMYLMYDIPTAASGSAVNSLVLATLAAPALSTTYAIEIIADHRNANATCKVYINKMLSADVSYLRDRLTNGYQSTNFSEAMVLSTAGAIGDRDYYTSNVVVYEPEVGDPEPAGPFRFAYAQAVNANLSSGPANDATGVTIDNEAWSTFDLSDITADDEIIAASVIYRMSGVDGIDATTAEVALESLGSQVGDTVSHEVIPGTAIQIHEIAVPETSLLLPVLNGMSVKIRSSGS